MQLDASVITLDFEGLKDSESVGNFYNGGTGGFGSGPGINYGIAFSPDATAYIQTNLSSGDITDTGLFGGEPSAFSALLFCSTCGESQSAETINVAAGFDSVFSLYYSAPDVFSSGGQLDIWSEPDGTGVDLGTLILPSTSSFDGLVNGNCEEYGAASDPGAPACPFVQLALAFSGTAKSVVFTGSSDVMYFDNVKFGTPEPATWMLIGAGLAGIACSRKLRSARS
jgi:hypothetical protein